MTGTTQAGLSDSIGQWRAIAGGPAATPDALASGMRSLYGAILAVDFDRLDVAEVNANARALTDDLFDLYLGLRDRIPTWAAAGAMTGGAPLAVRNAMRALRYTADIVGEVANGYRRLGANESTAAAFTGPPGTTLIHPSRPFGEPLELRSGDVVLVRGQLHNSAAIARIGDVDSQFSHVGIVHIDPDGRRWMVEALIEEGSTLTPLDEALGHCLGRAVVLRHRDRDLACRAAEIVATHVRSRSKGALDWIPYDFSMQLEGEERFFCSKLVRYGYLAASGRRMGLPSYPTRLDMTNRDFFDRLGVTAVDTFAPADFEVEPAFDIVAEWRDPRVTSSLRMQDLLMSKLFEWMETDGYVFRETLGMRMMAVLGRMTSFAPGVMKDGLVALGFPKIPSNMKMRTIATIGMLHETAQPILERLIKLEDVHIASTGRPMHPVAVQIELDRIRAASGGRIGYLRIP